MSRASAAFTRARNRLSAHLGDEAVLRGEPTPVVVIISRNVELLGEDGVVDRVVTTAAIPAERAPAAGDSLVVGAESWTLDVPLRSDADLPQWVLLPVLP